MQYYQFILSYYLKQHQKAEIRSKNVAQLLQLIFYVQLVSLLLVTKSDQLTQSKEEFNIDLRLTFKYLSYIGRPYQVFTETRSFRLYSFIIPTLFLTFISSGFMKKVIQNFFLKKNNQKRKDKHTSNWSKLISKIYQVYIYLFALYSFDCYLMPITETTGTQPFNNVSILIISIIQTTNLLLFVFINILSSESIHFQSSPLQVTQLKKNQFLNMFLIVICLYFKNSKYEWNYIPVQIMNIVILSYYIYEETKKKSSFLNLISLIVLAFSFFYNFTSLIFISADNHYQTGILFILCPFFINLLSIGQQQFNKIIVNKTRKIEDVYQNLRILAEERSKQKRKHQLEYIILTQKLTDQSNQDLFLSELSLFNKKIIKSQKSQKVFWYQKYIQIKYDLQSYTETISLIHHFQQKQFYSELTRQFFRVSISLSYFQQIQLDMIKNEVYQLLYLNITKNGDNLSQLTTKQYIQYKIAAENSQQILRDILMKKLDIYESTLSGKAMRENELFEKAMKLTKEALQLQKKLKLEMCVHKTFKIIQLLTILYIDFFNNVIQAELLRYSAMANEDQKENILEEMSFLGLELQDDMLQMKILHFSQDFYTNIGYNKVSSQIQNFEFNSLLADSFSEIHQNLVTNFLSSGICKKVGQDCELYIRGNLNNYYLILLQLQIQPLISGKISIFAFSKIVENQPKSLFINQNGKVLGQTFNFLTTLNSKRIIIDQKMMYLIDVNKLIKNFKSIPFQKVSRIKFFNTDEEFTGIKVEKNNLIELQLLETPETQNISQDELDQANQSVLLEPNQESFVVVPNSQCFEELHLPLSEERRDKTDQGLLKDEGKKVFITMIKSKAESDSQSMAGNAQNKSKNSFNEDKKDIIQADDQASSKFSRGFLDTSIYYSKYNKREQFLQKKQLLFVYLSVALFLIVLIINSTFYLISIIELVPNIQQVKNNQDLLNIKTNFLTPVHDCVVSQVAFVSYFMLLMYNQITYQALMSKSAFSRDAIEKSFSLLKDSYQAQLNNLYLQDLFYDESIEMYQFNQGILDSHKLPLKTALFSYLKSQYYVINDNKDLDLSKVVDLVATNDFAFFTSNILIVDNHFDILSQEVVDLIVNKSILHDDDGIKLFLKLTFLQSLFILLAFSYVFKIYSMSQKYFNLFTDFNQHAVQIEIQKLNSLITLLQKDSAYKLYNYDILIQEKKIQSYQINFSLKINQVRITSQKYNSPRFKILFSQIILILFFLLPQIIIQQIDSTFYEKYQVTSIWIEKISQTSSALSAIYSYREINYQISSKVISYSFFTEASRLAQAQKVLDELVKINDFINNFPFLDFSSLIIDDSTSTLLDTIQATDICQFVTHFNSTLAQEHCNNVYNGVAKLGIYNTISTIYRQISLEQENTQGFLVQFRPTVLPYEELEISLIVSDAIQSISDSLMNAVSQATDKIIAIHNILTGIYISLNILLFFSFILFYYPYLVKQQELVKNMIYLVPQYQFYLDQKFDTNFRLLIIQIK